MQTGKFAALVFAGFALTLCTPAFAAEPDDSGSSDDFYHEVGEGLKAAVERPDLAEANAAMREQDAREEQAREEARQEAAAAAQAERDREQAERDRYQREEYERRNANPNGPF